MKAVKRGVAGQGASRCDHPFENSVSLNGMLLVTSLCTYIWDGPIRNPISGKDQYRKPEGGLRNNFRNKS